MRCIRSALRAPYFTKVSTTTVAGQCCSCGGVNKLFAKATFNANTYLCQ